MIRNYQGNRQGKGYHSNRPSAGSLTMSQSGSSNPVAGSNNSSNAGASSANVLPAKDKSRSDAGDQSKSKTQSQPQPQAAPQSQSPTKMDCGSDSPADACVSSGSSESDRAAGRNASSPPAPGRKVTSEASDLKESLPHSSDLNGAPIVASAASSQIGGPGGYNRNNNWNSGGYNRNRNGMGRNNNWGSAGGRNCGPHSVHNSRPPHMAPVSAGYTGPPGRRFVTGPPGPFHAYGYPIPSGHLLPDAAAAAGLLPTPAALPAPFSPYGMCYCNSCLSQYYYFSAAAAAAQPVYAVPQPIPGVSMYQTSQPQDSFVSFQQQQSQHESAAGSQGPGMSPRPKGAPGPAVVYLQQQAPLPQKQQKPSESKAGLTPIPLPGGMNKQQPPRGPDQGQQQALFQMAPSHWTHQSLALAQSDLEQQAQQQQQQHQQQQQQIQQSLSGAAGVRYTYFPNIVNPQLMPAGVHDMGPAPLYHDVMNGQAGQPTYISGYTARYQ